MHASAGYRAVKCGDQQRGEIEVGREREVNTEGVETRGESDHGGNGKSHNLPYSSI